MHAQACRTMSVANQRVIKKYANRRLYDTEESRYVALEDIRQLVMDGRHFRIVDAQGGEDITRSILLQIIVEQEEKGQPILSTHLLEQLIRYYGDNLQAFVGAYLEKSMDFFIKEQQVLQDQMQNLLQAAPSSVWKEMAERNLTLWRDMQQDLLKTFISSTAGPARKDKNGR
jgi:polyhydroxyalkanoate synthesis repressor PhaR